MGGRTGTSDVGGRTAARQSVGPSVRWPVGTSGHCRPRQDGGAAAGEEMNLAGMRPWRLGAALRVNVPALLSPPPPPAAVTRPARFKFEEKLPEFQPPPPPPSPGVRRPLSRSLGLLPGPRFDGRETTLVRY